MYSPRKNYQVVLQRVTNSCRSTYSLFRCWFFHVESLGIFLPNTSWFQRNIFPALSSCSLHLDRNLSNRLLCKWHGSSFPKSERKWGPIGLLSSWRKSFLQLQRVVASKGGKTHWSDRGFKCNLNNWKSLASIYSWYCTGVQCDTFLIAMYVLVDKVWLSIFCNVPIS